MLIQTTSLTISDAERFLPMFRLLTELDVDFLRCAGAPPLASRIRRRHRCVFRMFLRELGAEVSASFHKRRELIARGAWSHLGDYYSDRAVFAYHYARLNIAVALHMIHVPAAPLWAEASLHPLLQMVAQPA
jgi:hypothetical protein